MKTVAFNGSPNKNGNTFHALQMVLDVLAQEGIETEMVHVGNKAIRGCLACGQCIKHRNERCIEVAPFVRTVFSVFKVESLPGVRLPVRPSAASRHTLRPGSFSLILNGAGTCCTSPNTA